METGQQAAAPASDMLAVAASCPDAAVAKVAPGVAESPAEVITATTFAGSAVDNNGDVGRLPSAAPTSEHEPLLRLWLEQDVYLGAGKKIVKLSDAKEKFPTIHMKWIELAFDRFEQEKLLIIPEIRSRIKLYEISPSQIRNVPTKIDEISGSKRTSESVVQQKPKIPKPEPVQSPIRPKSKKILEAASPLRSSSRSQIKSPSKSPGKLLSPSKGSLDCFIVIFIFIRVQNFY
jgi:hypothetical protein